MREKFENRTLTGNINVACKFDDGSVRHWTTRKEEVIAHIKFIVNKYSAAGDVLTLRQLHYQLVTRNWIVNHDTAYKKLGNILDDCRYAGVIDWDAIEDRGRVLYLPYAVKSVDQALQETVDYYRRDRQQGQTTCVELWTEKDALSAIMKRVTEKFHVRLVVNKGYTSSSAIYNAYSRVLEAIESGQKFVILYFGDHDPSGLDMIRDITDRLNLFLINGNRFNDAISAEKIRTWFKANRYTIHDLIDGGHFTVEEIKFINKNTSDKEYEGDRDALVDTVIRAQRRKYVADHELFSVIPIGLTKKQIKKYDLPPNPTKMTDSRSDKYVAEHGRTCWEVDALEPDVLRSLVETNIRKLIDVDLYDSLVEQEDADKEKIQSFIDNSKEEE